MDIAVVVLVVVSATGVGIVVSGTIVGLFIAVVVVILCFKSVEGPCGVLAPDQSTLHVFFFLL